jgi:signal transduction histidine kinase
MPTPASGWPGEFHYGLTGIQERATLIGAQLRIASALGEGTSIEVEKSLP